MKQLQFTTLPQDNGGTLNTKDTLLTLLKNHPQGVTLEQMENTLRILGILKQAGAQVLLEEADYKTVLDHILAVRWSTVDSAIVAFVQSIKNAVTIDPNAPSARTKPNEA